MKLAEGLVAKESILGTASCMGITLVSSLELAFLVMRPRNPLSSGSQP